MAASRNLYREMASTIHRQYEKSTDDERATIKILVSALCSDLKQDNMSFKREKFWAACFDL